MTTKKGTNKSEKLNGGNLDDILYGLGGNDTLDGGKGNDDLLGGDGNDKFIGRADGYDNMVGGKGTDTLSYASLSISINVNLPQDGAGTVIKGSTVDTFKSMENFVGSKVGDTIAGFSNGYAYGGKGADVLAMYGGVVRGDEGNDVLYGDYPRALKDTFWLQLGMGDDDIYYFTSGQDTIRLDGDDFKLGALVGYNEFISRNSGHAAFEKKPELIFDVSTHELYYDRDGTGSKEAVLIATISTSDTPQWSDFEIV